MHELASKAHPTDKNNIDKLSGAYKAWQYVLSCLRSAPIFIENNNDTSMALRVMLARNFFDET